VQVIAEEILWQTGMHTNRRVAFLNYANQIIFYGQFSYRYVLTTLHCNWKTGIRGGDFNQKVTGAGLSGLSDLCSSTTALRVL
jgi:hypothetical protein